MKERWNWCYQTEGSLLSMCVGLFFSLIGDGASVELTSNLGKAGVCWYGDANPFGTYDHLEFKEYMQSFLIHIPTLSMISHHRPVFKVV